ncbi:uncharacterized protein LOC119373786 [Rhipicephalus sanguineus]|uniref:uncharacterized protein LOC119373786 n=1 Tax=Rhipicephalus sanguineus TaxID=34632 RepID=UPI001895D4F2|nr:uncharacterized protein LOC119373786 [Rhipicephalus sanguineus]
MNGKLLTLGLLIFTVMTAESLHAQKSDAEGRTTTSHVLLVFWNASAAVWVTLTPVDSCCTAHVGLAVPSAAQDLTRNAHANAWQKQLLQVRDHLFNKRCLARCNRNAVVVFYTLLLTVPATSIVCIFF